MEIFTLLETLEDILENSKGLPFTNKTMVDKEELLEIIKENPRINVRQISEQIKEIKYDAVRWNIAELKKKKIIDRKGTTRKGVWSILLE